MKKKKWIIPLIITLIIIAIGSVVLFNFLNNENKLTSEERTWINTNISKVQNINVIKDENIFSKDGHGVFYSFLNDFKEEYGLNINVVTFENEAETVNLNYVQTIPENLDEDKIFYTDHYVLLSKNLEYFNNINDLDNMTIGTLNSELDHIKNHLKDVDVNYNGYDDIDEMLKDVGDSINYVIIPRMKYLDKILENNLEIVYHFSDINNYYILDGQDDTFSHILNKYFTKWQENIDASLKKEEFDLFVKSLKISDKDIDKLLSVNYRYGFINNSPYEIIMSGNYGGIVAEYLQEFSKFSGVYFDITKYKNTNKLVNAINKGKVDIYFSFNENIESNYEKTSNGINSSLAILTRKDNSRVINSIYGLQGEEVYVEKNSNLHKYLLDIPNIKIKTYETAKELFKLNKKDVIIVMDSYIFDYYSNNKLNNYVSKYQTFINNKYNFRIKKDYPTLQLLLNKYINYLDNFEMINNGINSHTNTIAKGSVLNNIAKYFILLIIAILVIGLFIYRKSKKIRIAKRLRKDDKIRFIDELTCLKNRTYLSDFMKTWNNNTIYPQTIIVVDLNRLKDINDKFGVAEGDKQIQAAANALIKTQLDNSDLMRSDGNEFVIYTIGYTQKQIINYIHKLNKEFKKLPYEYGAEFGYSIIENNLKTVEDALSEALESMREKKENGKIEK